MNMSSCAEWITPLKSHTSVMERLHYRSMLRASQEGRFSAQDTEYHMIQVDESSESSHKIFRRSAYEEKDDLPEPCTSMSEFCDGTGSRLRLMLQRTRPSHKSGKADCLPFTDAVSLQRAFRVLQLPASYLQIADGSLATAQAHIFHDVKGKPTSFEMIVYCTTKQGDWSMALSHHTSTMDTSIFCSLDKMIDAQPLVDDMIGLQNHSFHPMLIPCIMFDSVLSMGVERRNSIKERLQTLENTMARVSRMASLNSPLDAYQEPDQQDSGDWIQLFELLNSCRRDQASRNGRYDFWRSYHAAIQLGFKYTGELIAAAPNDTYLKAHLELEQWVALTWQKLNSLIARDKDHINRVETVSTLLYNLVQQRDIRLQSSIAKAAQRDSQDMKFIAVLGSVFLPASLIATILNVPEFQFLPGAQLFGAYLGITIPLIGFVVILCMTRSRWSKWKWRVWRRLPPSDQTKSAHMAS